MGASAGVAERGGREPGQERVRPEVVSGVPRQLQRWRRFPRWLGPPCDSNTILRGVATGAGSRWGLLGRRNCRWEGDAACTSREDAPVAGKGAGRSCRRDARPGRRQGGSLLPMGNKHPPAGIVEAGSSCQPFPPGGTPLRTANPILTSFDRPPEQTRTQGRPPETPDDLRRRRREDHGHHGARAPGRDRGLRAGPGAVPVAGDHRRLDRQCHRRAGGGLRPLPAGPPRR